RLALLPGDEQERDREERREGDEREVRGERDAQRRDRERPAEEHEGGGGGVVRRRRGGPLTLLLAGAPLDRPREDAGDQLIEADALGLGRTGKLVVPRGGHPYEQPPAVLRLGRFSRPGTASRLRGLRPSARRAHTD